MFPPSNMTADIKLTLQLQKEDWEIVRRVLGAAGASATDGVEQVRLQKVCHLMDDALSAVSSKQLLDSPMEVQSKIPIKVKVVKGDWH